LEGRSKRPPIRFGGPFDSRGGLGASAFRDGDKTFLHAEAFEHMDIATQVNQAAEALIATVNASLRGSDPAAQPLTVGPVVDAQGARTHFGGIHQTILARARAEADTVTVGGDAISQPPPAESAPAKRTRLIDSDADVARAVKFLNEPDETFGSLAKALEIVKDDLGQGNQERGGKLAAAIAGANEQDLLDFRENANDPGLSGDLARHAGKNKVRNPKTTRRMGRAEAADLVRRVVLAWIDAKK
jgi:hypothetical protein